MIKILNNIVYCEKISECKLDIYIPDDVNDNGILLFYIHGGGLEAGDKSDEEDIYSELAMLGYTVVSPNYRMYPNAAFPDYITDCANAFAWIINNMEHKEWKKIFIGGISAGAFISMQLHFNKEYLKAAGVDENIVSGYIFDAGQPTVHFNVLRERGMDTGAVRIDETAALYYVYGDCKPATEKKFLFVISDNDIPGRKEQNELLVKTMITHGYNKDDIDFVVLNDYTHAGYVHTLECSDESKKIKGYTELIDNFINCTYND